MKDIIKKALETKGLTQKELAEKIYVTPQAVSKWVNGDSLPDIENIVAINEALDIDLSKAYFQKKKKGNLNMKHIDVQNINSFEQIKHEALTIIEEVDIQHKYSRSVVNLVKWMIEAFIGLVHHDSTKERDDDDMFDFESVLCEMEEFVYIEDGLGEYSNRRNIENRFFVMGGDLFESFGEYKLVDHDICSSSMSSWYTFQNALPKDTNNLLYCEFVIAVCEIIEFYHG